MLRFVLVILTFNLWNIYFWGKVFIFHFFFVKVRFWQVAPSFCGSTTSRHGWTLICSVKKMKQLHLSWRWELISDSNFKHISLKYWSCFIMTQARAEEWPERKVLSLVLLGNVRGGRGRREEEESGFEGNGGTIESVARRRRRTTRSASRKPQGGSPSILKICR